MTEMHDAPPKKKRTWLWIVLGVFAFFVVTGVGMALMTAYWVGSHLEVVDTQPTDAGQAFDEARQRFPGQQPLLDFTDGQATTIAPTTTASTMALSTLHVIAFDNDEGKLIRVDVPFWLLRLKSGPIQFSSYAGHLDDRKVKLTVADIERRGPGIVLDIAEPNEGRVLIWAE